MDNPEDKTIKVRDFLQRNKIFFETVAAFLLSLMAIIISSAQIYISVKQNKLTSIQTEIARQQIMPHFVIAARQVVDQAIGKVREDHIYVDNGGGIVRDLLSNIAVFFDVELTPERGKQKKIEIPINGYYGTTKSTALGTGRVLEIEGYLNDEKISQIGKDLHNLAEQQKAFADVKIRRYLKLYYSDILGKEHTDYYYVQMIYGGSLIDSKRR